MRPRRLLALAVPLALSAAAAAAAPSGGAGVVAATGAIGPLRVDVSTRAAIVAFAGSPAAAVTGSFEASFAGYPKHFLALGYGCSRTRHVGPDPGAYEPAHVYCRTIYYLNPQTSRLAGFWTDSPAFRTPRGTRPGMTEAEVVRLERRKARPGAFPGIERATRRATLLIGTGCRHVSGNVCSGGSVAALLLESRHHPVGLLFE